MGLWFGFLPRSDVSTCSVKYKGTLLTSLLGRNPNQSPIFHRTVLEGYWELGAVMGTKMTATSCTFCSFRYISHRKQHFCEKVKKLTKFGAKTQLSLVKCWWKCWIKSGEMTLWHMPTWHSLFWFLHRARVQQKVNLSIFWCSTL